MSAESQLSHQDQSPSPWVLTYHFWKPHHMDSGELCSGLLETELILPEKDPGLELTLLSHLFLSRVSVHSVVSN